MAHKEMASHVAGSICMLLHDWLCQSSAASRICTISAAQTRLSL